MAVKINVLRNGHILKSPHYTYRIESVLGCGGFGITYLATANIKVGNVSLKGKFAIKEHFVSSDCERESDSNRVVYSNPAKERVENSKKDFISEAKRLHKIGVNHPNIIKVNEVFEANNTAYYVMEYLEGESLRSFVNKNGVMKEENLPSIINPIIEAVQYLHGNRMTHLDIKPDNIMLSHDDNGNLRPVLIDFGLSKHYDKDGKPTSTINTLGCSDGYAPVEQYAGITTFSPFADIYALGATIWFCLTGKNPKKSTDLEEAELASIIKPISKEISLLIENACRLNRNLRSIQLIHSAASSMNNRHTTTEDEARHVSTKLIESGKLNYQIFTFNNIAKRLICLFVLILVILETIFSFYGSYSWYGNGLYGIFKQVGTLSFLFLSVYGLTETDNFIQSKKAKFLWTISLALGLYCMDAYRFDLWSIIGWFVLFSIVITCYELSVRKFRKFTQVGFIISILLSLFWYTLS